MKFIGELIRWFQWYPLRWIVTHISRKQVVRLGYLIGELQFRLPRRKQRIASDELRKTIPGVSSEQEIKAIVRRSFREASSVYLETFCFPRINSQNVGQWMRVHGQENINQAMVKGKGVVLVLVHYGANQMIMAALGHRGYPINQIGSRPDDWHRLSGITPTRMEEQIFKLRLGLERSLPAEFIYIDRTMRPVYNCLKSNQVMLLACDGRAGARFLPTQVCGRTMNVSAGPFRIAAATGSALIPVFPVRGADGVHDLHIEQPIVPESKNSSLSYAEKTAELYGKRLTQWINTRPDHYLMLMTEAAIRSKIDTVPLFEDFRDERK